MSLQGTDLHQGWSFAFPRLVEPSGCSCSKQEVLPFTQQLLGALVARHISPPREVLALPEGAAMAPRRVLGGGGRGPKGCPGNDATNSFPVPSVSPWVWESAQQLALLVSDGSPKTAAQGPLNPQKRQVGSSGAAKVPPKNAQPGLRDPSPSFPWVSSHRGPGGFSRDRRTLSRHPPGSRGAGWLRCHLSRHGQEQFILFPASLPTMHRDLCQAHARRVGRGGAEPQNRDGVPQPGNVGAGQLSPSTAPQEASLAPRPPC